MRDYNVLLWKKVERYRWIFRLCPYLHEVFVVNSLARQEATQKSDIDLLVVTAPHRVAEVRFFLTVIMQLLAVRVHGNKVTGRFCLSFFVDEQHRDLAQLEYPNSHFLRDMMKDARSVYSSHITKKLPDFLRQPLEVLVKWHTRRALTRAQKSLFENPSIVISPSVFKFHENDARRK